MSKLSLSDIRKTPVNMRQKPRDIETEHMSTIERKVFYLEWQMREMNLSFESLDQRITHLEKYNKRLEVLLHRASDRMNDDAEVVGALRARIAPELGQFSNDVDAALTRKRPTKD